MTKKLSIILTTVITLLCPNNILAQETLYLGENQPNRSYLLNSTSTQINYEAQETITQTFYQTIEADQALIYTRGACNDVNLIPQLNNLNIPYICRSIDLPQQHRELVNLLYDIGVAGNIPLPVVYYKQKVLFDPNLEHINILNPVSVNSSQN